MQVQQTPANISHEHVTVVNTKQISLSAAQLHSRSFEVVAIQGHRLRHHWQPQYNTKSEKITIQTPLTVKIIICHCQFGILGPTLAVKFDFNLHKWRFSTLCGTPYGILRHFLHIQNYFQFLSSATAILWLADIWEIGLVCRWLVSRYCFLGADNWCYSGGGITAVCQ